MKNFIKKYSNLIIIIIFLFLLFIFIDDVIDKSILNSSVYNSYELQAKAWLNGKPYLNHDYSYLELAIYKGNYYVSFPPFPSVFLLPFVIIFNNNIPTNLIMFILFVTNFTIIYNIMKKNNNSELTSILISLGFTVGTNLMSLAIDSGVWFMAQLLNNTLCLLAVYSFLNNKKVLVYIFLSLAVGCRPFSAIYILMFFMYYLYKDRNFKKSDIFKRNFLPLIPIFLIAFCYMWYNYIRFNNVLEFGHNYLPEFMNSQYGQFNFHYLFPNLRDLFFNKINIDSKLNLSFNIPFSCFVANPVIIIYLYKTIKKLIVYKKIDVLRLLIFISVFLNIIFICMHKTLGAWQFGARYTCDILPFIFLGYIFYIDNNNNLKKISLDKFELICIIFGIMLNIFGSIIFHSYKIF